MADTEQKPRSEAQIYISALEDAIEEIADLVGVPHALAQLDTVRRRVKDIRAERDTAEARVKELEAKHATEIKASSTVNTSLMRQISKAHEALDAAGIPRSAEEDGEPGSPWTLGQRIAVLLIPGDDESPAEWAIDELDKIVHGEPRPFACDLDKLINAVKVMKSDIAAVWELWGAGREVKPGALHELCQEHERLSSALESKLRVIAESLDEADIPKRYGDSVDGGPIPVEERVALALTELEECGELMKTYNRQVVAFVGEVDAANAELCRLGAPRKAGDVFLNLVHRIRALPGLLRKD